MEGPSVNKVYLKLSYLLGLLLILLIVTSCTQPPEFSALADSEPEVKEAFTVLKGYLKRRNMEVLDTDVTSKLVGDTFIFRCVIADGEKYFSMQAKKNAWQIKEIPQNEHEPQ